MDSTFWSLIFNFRVKNKIGLDSDFADKLNYIMTSGVFVVSTLVLSIRYFSGKVIACWCPNEFVPIQVEFVESYCWTMSTYHYNMSAYAVPQSHRERDEIKLAHYQWIPFLLVLCSLMFHVPILIYRLMNWRSGIKIRQIMDLAVDVDMTHDKNDREGSVKFIARYLRDALCVRRRKKRRCFGRCKQSLARCCLWCGPNYGNYLILLYLFCKCLFLANALSQFLIMYRFLGAKHSLLYGLEFVESVAKGIAWDEDKAFPREVYCDFEIKRMYNTHRYTVQCVLPINLFAEKIFVFLWFWYCIVVLATAYSLLSWLWSMAIRSKRVKFVQRYLKYTKAWTKRCGVPESAVVEFVEKELRYDGVFVLHLVSLNCGELACAEIVSYMWKFHRSQNLTSNDNNSPLPEEDYRMNRLNANSSMDKHRSPNNTPVFNNISEV